VARNLVQEWHVFGLTCLWFQFPLAFWWGEQEMVVEESFLWCTFLGWRGILLLSILIWSDLRDMSYYFLSLFWINACSVHDG
jgi:hypothetical protein